MFANTMYKWVAQFIAVMVVIILLVAAPVAGAYKLKVVGNKKIILDGKCWQIRYRSIRDIDRDGRKEFIFAVEPYDDWQCHVIIARCSHGIMQLVADEEQGGDLRVDVSDVNGDGRIEVIARFISGDGHGLCWVYILKDNRLVSIGNFGDTRFADIEKDGVPEVLSMTDPSFGALGDFWLTIYKWNGNGYSDVGRRFPRLYDNVIRNIRLAIYRLQYTKYYGSSHTPSSSSELFGDLYYYLGKAYEYRGLLDKARIQYAIAYKLWPTADWTANAFRRTQKPGN